MPSLQWWTFEDAPVPRLIDYTGEPYNSPIGLTNETNDLPNVVAERLLRLVDDEFDSGSCEANGCTTPGATTMTGPRPQHVGYGLSGDADEITTWTLATIVLVHEDYDGTTGRVLVVCEDCDPSNIYERQP